MVDLGYLVDRFTVKSELLEGAAPGLEPGFSTLYLELARVRGPPTYRTSAWRGCPIRLDDAALL
jgi:hypothetical protein